ncbi:hypothetical protein L596_020300 [Steinernema carpocapsae]|uniref:Uncharacterized protein n=1 Tax=Steinernema carpocapsae TaxID=34508 RepID=A0A4U5MT32_STECR|nr:hypothetical protein L596_020300 [Steinernema carpocapsae]
MLRLFLNVVFPKDHITNFGAPRNYGEVSAVMNREFTKFDKMHQEPSHDNVPEYLPTVSEGTGSFSVDLADLLFHV